MIWIGISIAISLTLSFLLPFPLSLVAIIGVFIAMSYYIRRRQMRRMGMMGSNTGGGGFGSLFGGSGAGGVNYVCIACGQRFKGGSCPRCGSKMKRADFWLLLDKVSKLFIQKVNSSRHNVIHRARSTTTYPLLIVVWHNWLYELLDSIELFSTMSYFEHLATSISRAFFTGACAFARLCITSINSEKVVSFSRHNYCNCEV